MRFPRRLPRTVTKRRDPKIALHLILGCASERLPDSPRPKCASPPSTTGPSKSWPRNYSRRPGCWLRTQLHRGGFALRRFRRILRSFAVFAASKKLGKGEGLLEALRPTKRSLSPEMRPPRRDDRIRGEGRVRGNTTSDRWITRPTARAYTSKGYGSGDDSCPSPWPSPRRRRYPWDEPIRGEGTITPCPLPPVSLLSRAASARRAAAQGDTPRAPFWFVILSLRSISKCETCGGARSSRYRSPRVGRSVAEAAVRMVRSTLRGRWR